MLLIFNFLAIDGYLVIWPNVVGEFTRYEMTVVLLRTGVKYLIIHYNRCGNNTLDGFRHPGCSKLRQASRS